MCDIKLEVRLRFLGRERYNQEMAVDGREKSVGNKENEICMKLTYCDLLVCMLIKNKNVFSKYLKKKPNHRN